MSRYTITIEGDMPNSYVLQRAVEQLVMDLDLFHKSDLDYGESWEDAIDQVDRHWMEDRPVRLELGPLPDGSVIRVERSSENA